MAHTLIGTVWGFPILLPQYPLLTGTTDILAKMMAPRMAVATCQMDSCAVGAFYGATDSRQDNKNAGIAE